MQTLQRRGKDLQIVMAVGKSDDGDVPEVLRKGGANKMTKAELIAKLADLPDDAEVTFYNGDVVPVGDAVLTDGVIQLGEDAEVILRWEDPDGTQPSEYVRESKLESRIAELTDAGAVNINHG